MVPSENRVKRMRCGEKRREEGLKKKRCPKIRMPRESAENGEVKAEKNRELKD